MHQQRVSTPRTVQGGTALWSLWLGMDPGPRSWARLLLGVVMGALLVPGVQSFMSEQEEELLVELHNYYRGQVSPSASAMLPLRWDSSLKLMAEAYAAKCIWNHNPELEETGENLYAGTGPLDFAQAVEKWFMEHLDYDFQNNTCDEVKMCGHYTQMVWADTHRVGCAFHLCDKMDGLDWEDRTSFLVCNYFPAGNYEGVRPYVEGDWCSRCPENLQKCENNLCAPDLVDEDVGGDDHGTETDFVPTFPEELGDTETTHPPTEPDTTLVQTEPTEEEHTPTPGATAARVQPQDVLSSAPAPEPEEEEEEGEEEEQREESVIRKEEVRENLEISAPVDSGSGSGPSVLFLCLTAVLTLGM